MPGQASKTGKFFLTGTADGFSFDEIPESGRVVDRDELIQ
jgi:hypothetical protein